MRTPSVAKKKKGGGATVFYAILGFALLAGGVTFTLWNKGLGPFSRLDPNANTISVPYTTSAMGAGAEASKGIIFKYVPNDTIVPDDCVTLNDDLNGYVLRNDIQPNTILTWSMLAINQTVVSVEATSRYVEISYINLQSAIKVGDYIDIRFMTFNTAQGGTRTQATKYRDEMVSAKKEVIAVDGSTVTLNLTEDELLLLQSAGIEMSVVNNTEGDTGIAASLYTTIYVSPNIQPALPVTYSNPDALNMIRNNPGLAASIIKGPTFDEIAKPSTEDSEAVTPADNADGPAESDNGNSATQAIPLD